VYKLYTEKEEGTKEKEMITAVNELLMLAGYG